MLVGKLRHWWSPSIEKPHFSPSCPLVWSPPHAFPVRGSCCSGHLVGSSCCHHYQPFSLHSVEHSSGVASTTLATRPPPFHPPEEVVEVVDEPLVVEAGPPGASLCCACTSCACLRQSLARCPVLLHFQQSQDSLALPLPLTQDPCPLPFLPSFFPFEPSLPPPFFPFPFLPPFPLDPVYFHRGCICICHQMTPALLASVPLQKAFKKFSITHAITQLQTHMRPQLPRQATK